ncbi:MAG TPA: VOC family protein [Ramlibacter sp.]|jgi:predicted enzyme related to lactoylglutathione lyase
MDLLVNIDVPDVQQATSFYCHAFGLTRGRQLGPGVVELLGAQAPIYLLEKAEGTGSSGPDTQARSYARHWSPVHLDFVVDDIDAAVARAVAAGAKVEQPVRTSNWGKLAMLADPFGHGVCLVQFVGRGYDELVLTTPAG